MADTFTSLAMNAKNFAITQYTNFYFNSMCELEGKVYAASDNGIVELDGSDADCGVSIPAFFEFWIGDAGALNIKRIRSLHFGLLADGDMTVTVTDDDGYSKEYSISSTENTRHGNRLFLDRHHQGRYWKLKMSNIDSSYFMVDKIEASWIVSGSKQDGR